MKIYISPDLFSPTIPEGLYVAEVSDVQLQEASTGNLMLRVELTLLSDAGDGTKTKGRKIYDNFVLVEQSLWRLGAFIGATGGELPAKEYTPDELLSAVRSIVQGKKVRVRIGIEHDPEYGDRSRVRGYMPMRG